MKLGEKARCWMPVSGGEAHLAGCVPVFMDQVYYQARAGSWEDRRKEDLV